MEEKYVLIFDICSSTTILEDLNSNGELDKYELLIDEFNYFLKDNPLIPEYRLYKFLGDGYIILINPTVSIEKIIEFIFNLVIISEKVLHEFVKKYITLDKIPRIGITIGLDKGSILRISKGKEFIGKPINVAARLQGSLKDEDSIYKVLMTLKVYREFSNYLIKKACIERKRSFRNISLEQKLRCYELDLMQLKNYQLKDIKNPTKKLEKELEINKLEQYQSIYKSISKYKPIFK